MTLEELYTIIETRIESRKKNSYVSRLFESGTDQILKKVGEEAIEVVIAGKNKNRQEIISESADLLFHVLILLCEKKIQLKDIYDELEARRK